MELISLFVHDLTVELILTMQACITYWCRLLFTEEKGWSAGYWPYMIGVGDNPE